MKKKTGFLNKLTIRGKILFKKNKRHSEFAVSVGQ